jgi:heme-degrading monooxygenase HmoA
MGTSKEGTTRISIELRRWAIFAIWDDEESRQKFVDSSSVIERWRTSSLSLQHYFLQPISSRGTWNGIDPFPSVDGISVTGSTTAVLTRAAVRPQRWWRFARSVGAVDEALRGASECSLALGVGEWPIGEQATFSIWESAKAIDTFAYRDDAHSEVIRRTFREHWYSEMLFARFAVTEYLTD